MAKNIQKSIIPNFVKGMCSRLEDFIFDATVDAQSAKVCLTTVSDAE